MEKILIVDDNKDVRELVKATLGDDLYQVFEAASGEEAIALARKKIPHIIIMDIIMSGPVDGIQAARVIKKDPKTRQCHVIFLSGSRIDANRLKGFKSGAGQVEYFVKPFSPLHLLEKIETLCKKES